MGYPPGRVWDAFDGWHPFFLTLLVMWKLNKIKTISYTLSLLGEIGMFSKIKEWLSGKKLYLTAIAAIITATITWSQNAITTPEFIETLFVAVGSIFMRSAVAKSGPTT
jgi:hypothetical protein